MKSTGKDLVSLVQKELKKKADKQKAKEMASYMKTTMPFYGVQKPERALIMRRIKKEMPPSNQKDYINGIVALWCLKHREEKYLAIDYGLQFVQWADKDCMLVFETIVREGAWWDFIDPVSTQIIGRMLIDEKPGIKSLMKKWINDEDFWIRRSAILSQLKLKEKTDEKVLFNFCKKTMAEEEFFIRKAIGWALREYSYTEPELVKSFLIENQNKLSKLSYREGAKNLIKKGMLPKTSK